MSVRIEGLEKTLKNLKKLEPRIRKNVVNGAVRAGAVMLRDQARAEVPEGVDRISKDGYWHDAGTLRRSIVVYKKRRVATTTTLYGVGISYGRGAKNDGWYAHFIEYGTRKNRSNPFMRRAYMSKGQSTVSAAREYMRQRVQKEINKIG